MSALPPAFHEILILKSDRLCADTLHARCLEVAPSARIRLTGSIERARRYLQSTPVDLLIAGTEPVRDGDLLDFIARCTGNHTPARQVLIVTTHCEDRVLSVLRSLPVYGVFDATIDPPERLVQALHLLATGVRYWSPNLVARLQENHLGPNSVFRLLTTTEQRVLSIIGDGCDDISAAAILQLSPSTVSTIRRELHRKLRVQHRGELVRVAAQSGFVRFTPTGVDRPGFSLLANQRTSRPGRRPAIAINLPTPNAIALTLPRSSTKPRPTAKLRVLPPLPRNLSAPSFEPLPGTTHHLHRPA